MSCTLHKSYPVLTSMSTLVCVLDSLAIIRTKTICPIYRLTGFCKDESEKIKKMIGATEMIK